MKKEVTLKMQGAKKKVIWRKKRQPQKARGYQREQKINYHEMRAFAKPKIKQDHQFTETGFANMTVKGESDAFRFGNHKMWILITNCTKAMLQNKSHEGDVTKQVARDWRHKTDHMRVTL
jgi:hypothetical protein